MSESALRLDAENPWPGLEAFDEAGRAFFHGRDEEIAELARKVREAPLTVLFGKSGLGKTSLLRAGLFPRLREEHCFPVYVRLALRADAPSFLDQMADALRTTLHEEAIDAPVMREGERLWAYLHRADLEFWNARNFPVIPVFVLDQFEEVFTLGAGLREAIARLRSDLGDLAENRIPEALKEALTRAEADAPALTVRKMPYKLLLSLREDFLPELESWRPAIPSLGKVRLRLLPLRPTQALDAVLGAAPRLVDKNTARRIVDFVAAAAQSSGETASAGDVAASAADIAAGPVDITAGAVDVAASAVDVAPSAADVTASAAEVAPSTTDVAASATGDRAIGVEIEPALLSLFCRGLNEARKKAGKARIDAELLEGAKQSIIGDYYESCFEGMPPSVSRFVETELITEKGFRNSFAREDAVPAHLSEAQLQRLVNMRLLRIGESYGAQRIELTHDLLTRVVREHRDRRRIEEDKLAAAQRAAAEREALQREAREREEKLETERLREREQHLQDEARAGRRFKLLSIGLAVVLAFAIFAAGTAYRQSNEAERQRSDAMRLRSEAETQRNLAQERLQRITDGLRMKQAVLSGDRAEIEAFLRKSAQAGEARVPSKPSAVTPDGASTPGPAQPSVRPPDAAQASAAPARIRFTAKAEDLRYRNPSGQEVYRFSLMPDASMLAEVKKTVAVITYRMDHPTFQNALLATGPERDFAASYIGWGCLRRVLVLIEYIEPDRPPEIEEYDMCKAVGW